MDFIAVDFETANAHQDPCSIGLLVVKDNEITEEIYRLIKPPGNFHIYNTKIHGISERTVSKSPTFAELWPELRVYFDSYPVVAHNLAFDMYVLKMALNEYDLDCVMHQLEAYCTMNLYKMICPGVSYKLPSVCEALGIALDEHHNALADARATASVMLRILEYVKADPRMNMTAEDLCSSIIEQNRCRADEPTTWAKTKSVMDETDIEFAGRCFVITGEADGYTRANIKKLIEQKSGRVTGSVSSKTDYLIVGVKDVSVIKDKDNVRSTKLIKAEEMKQQGHHIKIVCVDELLEQLID